MIPCYKQAHFLCEAVESVCAQSFQALEIVIVDDGSPDDTSAVAQRVVREHPERRIRLVRQHNKGLPAARNRGIAVSTAEYVLPLDADDKLSPAFVARCVAALDRRQDCSIAYGGQQNFGEDDCFHPHPPYDFVALTHANQLGVASMFRRVAWEDVGGYSEHLPAYEDWDFWIGCGERGHFGLHVPDAVFHYRVRTGSMFDRVDDQRCKALIVANHPVLYSPEQSAWARGVLVQDEASCAIDGPRYQIPALGDSPVCFVHGHGTLREARGFATLALAEELVHDAALLAAYTDAFSGGDAATLVAYGSDDELSRIGAALAEQGRDGPDAADLLGVPADGDDRTLMRLAGMVDAFLTRSAVPLPVPLPRADVAGIDNLRRWATSRDAYPRDPGRSLVSSAPERAPITCA